MSIKSEQVFKSSTYGSKVILLRLTIWSTLSFSLRNWLIPRLRWTSFHQKQHQPDATVLRRVKLYRRVDDGKGIDDVDRVSVVVRLVGRVADVEGEVESDARRFGRRGVVLPTAGTDVIKRLFAVNDGGNYWKVEIPLTYKRDWANRYYLEGLQR